MGVLIEEIKENLEKRGAHFVKLCFKDGAERIEYIELLKKDQLWLFLKRKRCLYRLKM